MILAHLLKKSYLEVLINEQYVHLQANLNCFQSPQEQYFFFCYIIPALFYLSFLIMLIVISEGSVE